jgi:enterochelin esterase-like enzyme
VRTAPSSSTPTGTITGTRDGAPHVYQPAAQQFLRLDPVTLLETGNRSRFFRDTVDSELEGAPREFVTYLPPSYLEQPEREYPVVYLLHGVNGGSREWEPREMDEVLDGLWAQGLAESIVVMPDGESLWYLDGEVPWRSMFLTEMVPLVDAEYRTLASREFRALSGVSMGGYGAYSIGLSNPDMFSSLASHIGSLGYTPAGPTPIAQAQTMTAEQLGRFDHYMDACEFDDFGFDNGVRQMSAILTAAGVEHTAEVYPEGRHDDACWLPHVDRSFASHSEHFRAAGLREDYVAPQLSLTADPDVVVPPNLRMRTVRIDVTATDETSGATVALVDVQVDGPARARVVRRSDTEFSVRAVRGARYTFVYQATDAAGNVARQSITVAVGPVRPRG